jgi:hypothetical protein
MVIAGGKRRQTLIVHAARERAGGGGRMVQLSQRVRCWATKASSVSSG